MAIELDEVDVQLLTALQADADRTNVQLARIAGLSPAATLHRVRWLKQSGVIRIISAQLDPAAAGFPLQMYVTATLARHDPRSTRVFEDQVRALPQIIAADNVAGEMDYFLTVVARDVAELQQVLANLATRGGQRLVTYLRLAEVKPPSRRPRAAHPASAAVARGRAPACEAVKDLSGRRRHRHRRWPGRCPAEPGRWQRTQATGAAGRGDSPKVRRAIGNAVNVSFGRLGLLRHCYIGAASLDRMGGMHADRPLRALGDGWCQPAACGSWVAPDVTRPSAASGCLPFWPGIDGTHCSGSAPGLSRSPVR